VSQNIKALSHATEHSSRPLDPGWNATSSTVSVCPLNLCLGSSAAARGDREGDFRTASPPFSTPEARHNAATVVVLHVPKQHLRVLPAGGHLEGVAAHGERKLGVFLVADEREVRLGGLARAVRLGAPERVRRGRARFPVRLRLRVPDEELRRVRVRDEQTRARLELADLVHLAGVDDLLPALDERRAALLLEREVLRRRDPALDDVHVRDHQRVRVLRAPVRLLGEVQSLLVFELVALEDRAPSAGQRGPHQPVVREPVVQEGHERLPPRVIGVYVGRVRHRERGRQRGERARVSVRERWYG
jgi:hypothetical protein